MPKTAVIAVAMSGGVDSSVAAARIVRRGFNAIGVTLALWPRTRELVRDRGCCSMDAVDDARRVASAIGMRHYVWNMEDEFHTSVVREFEDEYADGRTPNPCVRCNERIKFGLLLQRARAVGATHVATGHYARIGLRGSTWTLHRARDKQKDQSYTLHRLDQEQLARAVFPLGAVASKDDVRVEARELDLVAANKPDSQDLCFIDGSMSEDLGRRLAGRYSPGPITDAAGNELGRHRGLPFYTVGQRSHLGLAPKTPDAVPLRVIAVRAEENTVVVGSAAELERRDIRIRDSHWTGGPPARRAACLAQLRAHGEARRARVLKQEGDLTRIRLDDPAPNVSPGQSVVLYAGDEVLGGGVISDGH